MAKKITKPEVLKELRELVASKPEDYRYDSTKHTEHKQVNNVNYSYDDCIAGCVIRVLDPELHSEILEYEAQRNNSFALSTGKEYEIGRRVIKRFTPAAYAVLQAAQVKQDSEQTWREALMAAEGAR